MTENGSEMFLMNALNEPPLAAGACPLLAVCDLAANFSGLEPAISERRPRHRGPTDEGCKLKICLLRLFVSRNFDI